MHTALRGSPLLTPKGYLGHTSVQRKVRVFLRLLGSRSSQCINRQASGDFSGTEAGRLEGAGPIYKAKGLTESPFIGVLMGAD
jgi:hypothetical protein